MVASVGPIYSIMSDQHGDQHGGHTAAILASLTRTCRRHDFDPQLYCTQLLMNLPQTKMSESSERLPDPWRLRHAQRLANRQSAPPSTAHQWFAASAAGASR